MALTPWQLRHPLAADGGTPSYLYVVRHFVGVVAESAHVRTYSLRRASACVRGHSQSWLIAHCCAGKGAFDDMDELFCLASVQPETES